MSIANSIGRRQLRAKSLRNISALLWHTNQSGTSCQQSIPYTTHNKLSPSKYINCPIRASERSMHSVRSAAIEDDPCDVRIQWVMITVSTYLSCSAHASLILLHIILHVYLLWRIRIRSIHVICIYRIIIINIQHKRVSFVCVCVLFIDPIQPRKQDKSIYDGGFSERKTTDSIGSK